MMRNFRILYVACVVVLLCCLVAPLAPAAADAAPDEPSSPYVIFPKDEDVFTTTPKFRFTKYPGVTKYRIDIWEGDDFDAPPIYTFKFTPSCSSDECWYKPDIVLKKYDISGEKGEYSWRIRAKEGTEWPPLWSQTSFRVLSSGFTSTFDVNANKWQALAGDWTLTSAGYLKTLGLYNTTATILRQEMFVDGIVYEVVMKRKVESDSSNRLLFHGVPGDTYVSGYWQDCYVLQYTNDGKWSLFESVNYTKNYFVNEEPTTAINPYGWNTLTVWKNPTNICVWINKVYLGCYSASTFSSGWVGIGVFESDALSSPLLVDRVTVKYSNIAPYTIP